jgi:hypothetical protein
MVKLSVIMITIIIGFIVCSGSQPANRGYGSRQECRPPRFST